MVIFVILSYDTLSKLSKQAQDITPWIWWAVFGVYFLVGVLIFVKDYLRMGRERVSAT